MLHLINVRWRHHLRTSIRNMFPTHPSIVSEHCFIFHPMSLNHCFIFHPLFIFPQKNFGRSEIRVVNLPVLYMTHKTTGPRCPAIVQQITKKRKSWFCALVKPHLYPQMRRLIQLYSSRTKNIT